MQPMAIFHPRQALDRIVVLDAEKLLFMYNPVDMKESIVTIHDILHFRGTRPGSCFRKASSIVTMRKSQMGIVDPELASSYGPANEQQPSLSLHYGRPLRSSCSRRCASQAVAFSLRS